MWRCQIVLCRGLRHRQSDAILWLCLCLVDSWHPGLALIGCRPALDDDDLWKCEVSVGNPFPRDYWPRATQVPTYYPTPGPSPYSTPDWSTDNPTRSNSPASTDERKLSHTSEPEPTESPTAPPAFAVKTTSVCAAINPSDALDNALDVSEPVA